MPVVIISQRAPLIEENAEFGSASHATKLCNYVSKTSIGIRVGKLVELDGTPVDQRPVFAGKHVSRQLEMSCQSGEPRDGPFRQRPPAIRPVPAIFRLIIGVILLALLFRARPGRELAKTRVESLGRRIKHQSQGRISTPENQVQSSRPRCLH